jgi:multidrug efflux pump subunit AcrA (membrane-fusion protein)
MQRLLSTINFRTMSSNKMNIFLAIILFSSCGKKMEETKPIRKDITETVFASGILEANNTYNLTAQVEGYLVKVNFNEGDVVTTGKQMATIENKESSVNVASANDLHQIAVNNTKSNAPLLLQAKNNIAISYEKMQQDLLQEQRYKRLLNQNSIARVEYENILLAYQNSAKNYAIAKETYNKTLNDAEQQTINTNTSKQLNAVSQNKNIVKAIVGGKVYQKLKQQGDFVRRGDVIAVIGDGDFIYAKINVDEGNIGKIKLQQEADVQLNTNKDKTYKATVFEILPSFDEASQSFICKLKFTDPLDFSIIKTQLQANIILATHKNVLLIPRNYVDFGGNVQIKGKKELTKITTQFVSNEWVQVLSGVTENDILITDNIAANKTTTSEQGAQMK